MLRKDTFFCDVCRAEILEKDSSQAINLSAEDLTILLNTIDLTTLSRKPDGTVCVDLCVDCEPDVKQKLEAILTLSTSS